MRGPRLLLALPQSLFDRSSGAAVSMRHLACQLARQGWQVRLLCTTATESGRAGRPLPGEDLGGAELELIELPEGVGRDWSRFDGGQFERRSLELLRSFRPQLFLSYGADALEHRLCAAAQACGAKVLLALHNLAYLQLRLPPCDAVLLPSRFMAERYAGCLPVPALVLPPPIWDPDVLVASHEPVYATFVNPEPEKGAARVAWLAAACPQWPFLIVEGRAGATAFVSAARQAGVDPAALGNVHLVQGERPVRELLALTRVLLMPSRVEEAAGRLAAEAVANGIPALVSDRGGLPEMVEGTSGLMAEEADEAASRERWRQALLALQDDAGWRVAAGRAAAVAPRWRSAWQAPRAAVSLAALLRG